MILGKKMQMEIVCVLKDIMKIKMVIVLLVFMNVIIALIIRIVLNVKAKTHKFLMESVNVMIIII